MNLGPRGQNISAIIKSQFAVSLDHSCFTTQRFARAHSATPRVIGRPLQSEIYYITTKGWRILAITCECALPRLLLSDGGPRQDRWHPRCFQSQFGGPPPACMT